jgi:2,3-bisphosphoglycerate-dependent phosphoglycerate mutase
MVVGEEQRTLSVSGGRPVGTCHLPAVGDAARAIGALAPRQRRSFGQMATTIVFETHALSQDNEHGIASGWVHSRLSESGRQLAAELGERRRNDGVAAVFSSDLHRAAETAAIAFPSGTPPVLLDWRLRECDFGERNGAPADIHGRDRARYLDEPYPGGESWRQATARVARWLDDVALRWRGARVLVVGHVATRWALDHHLDGVPLERLVAKDFTWQEGWEYHVSA